MIDISADTRVLVESYARAHDMSPEEAAFYLAVRGRTTHRRGDARKAAPVAIFCASVGRTTHGDGKAEEVVHG